MEENEYTLSSGEPIKCYQCKGTDFVRINKDWIEGHLCELEVRCKTCDICLGYWSYGHWEF